jgi:thiamine-monophosphate kinase
MLNKQSEFQIIEHYFKKNKSNVAGIIKGIGDDAAVVDVSNQSNLIISMDTLIEGVHFPKNTSPYEIGIKALAVNLSDLAAMGATPAWFTLALTLPDSESEWLKNFSHGLFDIASEYNIDLIGGDTTRGPLSITIQIAGYVSDSKIMYRSGAQINDDIYVSGYLGDAGAGLQLLSNPSQIKKTSDYLVNRLNRPTPRVTVGKHIRQFTNACIDISDGLITDLKHIIELSECGAKINVDKLPISDELKTTQNLESCYQLALSAGDDYELCFTAAENHSEKIKRIAAQDKVLLTKIGKISNGSEFQCYFNNQPYEINYNGYEHFKN